MYGVGANTCEILGEPFPPSPARLGGDRTRPAPRRHIPTTLTPCRKPVLHRNRGGNKFVRSRTQYNLPLLASMPELVNGFAPGNSKKSQNRIDRFAIRRAFQDFSSVSA
jgi:hypothetical protein